MTLGQNIQTARRAKGLSQEALAERIGVSRQALGKWEKDTALPGLDNLQALAAELGRSDGFLLLCGHYEGVDQRFLDECVDEEISMGDFVVTGGEIPAMAVTDAICRMVPGVLPEEECFTEESHWAGLLEYPQYSRPDEWHGRRVPDVLLSGHHENVAKWRKKESYKRTMLRRPDLWAQFDEKQLKTKSEKKVLAEAKAEAEAIRAAEAEKAEENPTEE